MPVWLQRAGYYTAHIGKYLNGYGASSVDTHVPPGWSEWYGSLDDPDGFIGGTYTMYGYTLNENGSIVHYGSTPDAVDPATYQTDVYAVKAEDFINRRAPKGKPFYLSVAPLAPHGEAMGVCDCAGDNPRAAVRHQGRFASEPVPRPPSFNEADVSDKPAGIQALTPINATQRAAIDDRYRARLESLLAVDEMVGRTGERAEGQGRARPNRVHLHVRQRVLPRRAPPPLREGPPLRGVERRPADRPRAGCAEGRDPPPAGGERRPGADHSRLRGRRSRTDDGRAVAGAADGGQAARPGRGS